MKPKEPVLIDSRTKKPNDRCDLNLGRHKKGYQEKSLSDNRRIPGAVYYTPTPSEPCDPWTDLENS